MADENFEIRVQDKVDSTVPGKFKAIAADANKAANAIERLEKALSQVGNTSALEKLNSAVNKNATHQQRLQTEYNKTQASLHNVEAALQRKIAAEARAATAIERLSAMQNKSLISNNKTAVSAINVATASAKLERAATLVTSAQNSAATSAQRLVSEQKRTETAMAQTNVVIARQATEQQRLATEQQRTVASTAAAASAQQRLATAQVNTTTAQQRLATAQNQTASSAANLATAQQRTTNATLQGNIATQNLANTQARGTVIAQNLATAQQRTATATSNAAAAATRAQTAALRLQQAQARLNQAGAGTNTIFAAMAGRLAALAGTGYGVVGIVKLADSYTNLQNKLQNVTTSQEQVNRLTKELEEVSVRSRSNLEATTTAFARFDRSLKNMGKTQEDSLRMTETINKALIVSGATAAEANSALLQLSQGFNAGRLMGDEFRAVAENMPITLEAIAKVMDVPIMQLKKLSSEGKITSAVLFDAFKLIREQIDETYAKTSPTLAQSFEVLRTRAIAFFGELDKKYGITKAMSGAIIELANSLDRVVPAMAGLAAMAAIAFAPKVIAAVGGMATALGAMGAAIVATPWGAAALAIVAIGTAVIGFGDKVKLGESKLYDLQDAILGTYDIGVSAFSDLGDTLKDTFGGATEWVAENLAELPGHFGTALSTIGKVVKGAVNIIVGMFVGLGKTIGMTLAHLPANFRTVWNTIANATATAVETVVNFWTKGFSLIATGLGGLMPEVAASLNGAIDAMTLKLPRLDTSNAANSAEELKTIWKDAFSTDFVGDVGKKIGDNALARANARRAAIDAESSTQLRGEGKDITGGDSAGKGGKGAEKRAALLAKVNAQLDNEIARMNMLQPLREAQQKFDQIEEQLIGKKITLNDAERKSIMDKILAINTAQQAQAKMDEIYERAIGPMREYEATLEGAQILLNKGAISQQEYAGAVAKAAIEYAKARDPLYEFTEQLDRQIDLLRIAPNLREIETQVMQAQQSALANGILLTEMEVSALRDKLLVMQQLNGITQQESNLYTSTVGARQQFLDQLTAIKNLRAMDNGFSAGDQAASTEGMLGSMGIDTSTMQVWQDAQLSMYQTYYSQLEAMRAQDLITEQDYANARAQLVVKENQVKSQAYLNFFDSLANMQNSNVKALARIGKAAAITQAVINTYEGATKALAQGGIYGAVMAAGVVATGMAQVAQIRSQSAGFMAGGYTGGSSTTEERGVVHGKEFVMDAEATNRIGVSNLQSLQSGASNLQDFGGQSSSGPVNVTVDAPQNTKIINVLDPALVGEYLATDDGERLIINTVRRNKELLGS